MQEEYAYSGIGGLGTLSDQKRKVRPLGTPRDVNSVADIEGASVKVAYGEKYKNKPTFTNADIEKSGPAPLVKQKNVRDLSLVIEDIPGTRHTVRDRMMRTTRHVNPLNPDYPLPTYNPAVLPEPKFLRDAHDVSDIEGAKAKPRKEIKARDIMNNDDVVGAKAGWKPRHRRCRAEAPPHSVMMESGPELKDVKFAERSTRVTNPVDPVYMVDGMEVKNDEGSKSKPAKKHITDNSGLRTDDIDGAQQGYRQMKRREYRNIMTTLDVEGAQADTVFHTIQTARVVDPLNPVYMDLDGVVSAPSAKPLIPPSMAGIPTIKHKKNNPTLAPIDANQGSTEKEKGYAASSFADKAGQENAPPPTSRTPAQGHVKLPEISKLDLSKAASGEKGPSSSRKTSAREESERLAEIAAVREL